MFYSVQTFSLTGAKLYSHSERLFKSSLNDFFVELLYSLNSPWLKATFTNAPPYGTRCASLVEPRGQVRASVFRPAWLSFNAPRRCCGGACYLRACRPMGSAPTATRGRQYRRSAREHLLFSLRTIATSGLRRPPDARADPRRPENPQPLHAGHPHLQRNRRRRAGAADRRAARAQSHARHLDRQERSPQRARNPVGHRARAPL